MKLYLYIVFFLLNFFQIQNAQEKQPSCVCVLIVDQLRQDTLELLKPFFTGGLKTLLERGIVYSNAYVPHGMPSTAPGHTALATGTWAKNHGIIANNWYTKNGTGVKCDDDHRAKSAVFSPKNTYSYGKSAHQLLVDTISDQLLLNKANAQVYALSLKSRSAIFPAGATGKAIWFDREAGQFTSSKAYYDKLPTWLTAFNAKYKKIPSQLPFWNLTFVRNHPAYKLAEHMNYEFAARPSLIRTKLGDQHRREKDEKYELFLRTPQAHHLILNCAQHLLGQQWLNTNKPPLLLWLGLTSFDKIGHLYGPRSLEYIDMLFKLDKQLEQFFNWIAARTNSNEVMFVLTADHGGAEIPENLQQQGISAYRIHSKKLVEKINTQIQARYKLDCIAKKIRMFSLYLNEQILQQLDTKIKEAVLQDIKEIIRQEPGIKNVYTYQELEQKSFNKNDRDYWYQQQLHPQRTGQIIIQVLPHTYVSPHPKGTGHRTPYNYDTHIPLIFYHPGTTQGSVFEQKVYTPQLAATLAKVFGVPKPSAASFQALQRW